MTAATTTGCGRDLPSAGHSSSRSDRVVGLDVARAVALLGMFGAHVGLPEDLSWSPSSWAAVVHGRSAALFAVLAGVSIGLLAGGRRPATGDGLVRARVRILVRAAWVFLIGGLLELLGTEVAVILGYYAVLFVLALPFLRWSPARLLVVAAGLAVAAPPVALLVSRMAADSEVETPFITLLFSGDYPALWWWTFLLVGLALARLDLTAGSIRAVLLAAGTAAAVTGYGLGWLSTRLLTDGRPSAGLEDGYESSGTWDWAWLSGAQPHSGTIFWLVASAGVAVAVIAVCLVVAEVLPRLSHPFAAVGGIALTVYSLQIAALWAVEPDLPAWAGWILFSTVVVVLSVLWRHVARRGPLERLLTWSSNRAAGSVGWAAPPPLPRVPPVETTDPLGHAVPRTDGVGPPRPRPHP